MKIMKRTFAIIMVLLMMVASTTTALAGRGDIIDGFEPDNDGFTIHEEEEVTIEEAAELISQARGISYDEAIKEIGRLPQNVSLYKKYATKQNGSVVFEAGVMAKVYNSGSFRQFESVEQSYAMAYDTRSGVKASISYTPMYCTHSMNSPSQVQLRASGVVQEVKYGSSNTHQISLAVYSYSASGITFYYTWTPNPQIDFVWNLY